MELSRKQAEILNTFIEAMLSVIDDMPDFAQHLQALEAAGIDLREIRVQACIKVNAEERTAVQTGVPMPLPGASAEDHDAAFLRDLRICPDFQPAAEPQPKAATPARPTWWQRLHGGR
jgi:hypothetical protein